MWCLYVGLHCFLHLAQLNPPCLAGNFSLPLNTNGGFFEAISHTVGRYGSVIIDALLCYFPCSTFVLILFLVDLLPHACGRSSGRDFVPYHYGHYNPNQLSGGYRVLVCLLTRALICHNFKLWVVCSVVSNLSYAFSSLRERLSPCRFS